MVAVLATEIIDQQSRSIEHDRPSRAAITIQYTRNPIRVRQSPRRAVKITAPVVNGELHVHVSFYNNGLSGNGSEPLQYNATNNLDAAAICVEGFVQCSGKFLRAKMHTVIDDGALSQTWFDWSLNPNDWPESQHDWSLLEKLQHIFKILLVDR